MNTLTKYKQSFINAFGTKEDELQNLKYQEIDAWDSIGHMTLIAQIEESFSIIMDIDDIIDLSSYEKGIEILKEKYNVSF